VDANWNLVNTITHTIAITSSDATATLPSNAALVSGTQTFSVTFNTVSVSGWTVTVTDQNSSPLLANIGTPTPVVAGALDHFVLSLSTPQCDGSAFWGTNTLTAKDAENNTITTFNASSDNVTITANSPLSGTISGLSGGNMLTSGSDFVSGIANLTNLTYTGTSGVEGTLTAASADSKTGSADLTITSIGTWLGTTSTDWNDATNWCGGIPTLSRDVIIPSGGNQPIIGSPGGLCRNLTINGTLTISSTYGLTVSGNWTNNGTFVAHSSTVTFNGTTTISGTGTGGFYNVTLSSSASVTTTVGTTILNNLVIEP
jgi:hypothetical protein